MNRAAAPSFTAVGRLALVVASAVVLVAVLLLAVWVTQHGLMPFDVPIAAALQAVSIPGFAHIMQAVSVPGRSPWNGIVVMAVAGLVAWRWGRGLALYLLAVVAAEGLLSQVVKRLVARPRPDPSLVKVFVAESGYSFPSGHVLFYTVFFGFLIFLAMRYLPRGAPRVAVVACLAVLIFLVGPSRVFLGAHWPSDVLAGYLIGLVVLGWAILGYRAWQNWRRNA